MKKLLLLIGLSIFIMPSLSFGLEDDFNLLSWTDVNEEFEKRRQKILDINPLFSTKNSPEVLTATCYSIYDENCVKEVETSQGKLYLVNVKIDHKLKEDKNLKKLTKNQEYEKSKLLNSIKSRIEKGWPSGAVKLLNQSEASLLLSQFEINELKELISNGYLLANRYDLALKYSGKTIGIGNYSNENVYVGEFINGQLNGEGVVIFVSGNKYVGSLKNNKFNGHGIYYYQNSKNYYVGEFRDGLPNGQGKKYFFNGDVFDGKWSNDKRHGEGILTLASGEKIIQDWKYGLLNDDKIIALNNNELEIKKMEENIVIFCEWRDKYTNSLYIFLINKNESQNCKSVNNKSKESTKEKYCKIWKNSKVGKELCNNKTNINVANLNLAKKQTKSQENVVLLNNERVSKTKIQTKSQKKKGFFGDLATMGRDLLSGNFKGAKGQRQYLRKYEPSGQHTQEASGPNNRQVRVNQQGNQQFYNPIKEEILNSMGWTQRNLMAEEMLHGSPYVNRVRDCLGSYRGSSC